MLKNPRLDSQAFLDQLVMLARDQIMGFAAVQCDEEYVKHLEIVYDETGELRQYKQVQNIPHKMSRVLYTACMYAEDEIHSMIDAKIVEPEDLKRVNAYLRKLILFRREQFGKTILERIDDQVKERNKGKK